MAARLLVRVAVLAVLAWGLWQAVTLYRTGTLTWSGLQGRTPCTFMFADGRAVLPGEVSTDAVRTTNLRARVKGGSNIVVVPVQFERYSHTEALKPIPADVALDEPRAIKYCLAGAGTSLVS